jgi:hypothetical protein
MSAFGRAADSAERLSRTVLGTLALFLLLIYFIAGVTLVWAKLDPLNQTILTFFIALFPVLVLIVFYRLVTGHYSKLINPDTVNQATYERIVLETLKVEAIARGRERNGDQEAPKVRAQIDSAAQDSTSVEQKSELHRILDWYTPEWRQKRYLFRRAAEQFGDQPEVVFSDAKITRDVVDIFRFIDHVGMSIEMGMIDGEKIPVEFRKSAARYATRGGRWLAWLRENKNDNSRYQYFERITRKWAAEKSAS